jgi:2,4-didehydro-3-deoxy-L-rhamnonate hydrolase
MKLIRFGPKGFELPGVELEDGMRLDVSSRIEDYSGSFFASNGLRLLKEWALSDFEGAPVVPDEVRLGPPVARPGKMVCIGLNYSDHARETGAKIPSEPVLFFKATSAIVGPNDELVMPKNSNSTDWEVELAVVIGKKASYIEETHALEHVAGYVLHNDYSERDFQLKRGGQWVKGKSCDTFAPLGPWLVTPDEVGEVQLLDMWLTVNGKMMQNSSTSNMVFGVPHLISYVSQFMTLEPGDIISTGTPAGVGLGMDPPEYLKEGDIVELGIDGLGSSKQIVKAWRVDS